MAEGEIPNEPSDVETDDEHERSLGRLVIAASRLEASLRLLMGNFFTSDPIIARIVIDRMQMSTMIELTTALVAARCREESLRAQWRDLAARIGAAVKRRNELIHSRWAVGVQDRAKFRDRQKRSAQTGLTADWALETPAEIDVATTTIRECMVGVFEFAEAAKEYQQRGFSPPLAPWLMP